MSWKVIPKWAVIASGNVGKISWLLDLNWHRWMVGVVFYPRDPMNAMTAHVYLLPLCLCLWERKEMP